MPKHAVLSASSASRWLTCTPSARLNELYDDEASQFSREGTDAHNLCEYRLKQMLGLVCEKPKLSTYDEEMEECANDYITYIDSIIANKSDLDVLIEQRLDYSNYVEGGYGYGDCVIIGDGEINVIDFKYGKGIPVNAEWNPQMMLYALGALNMVNEKDIQTIKMTIFQPRICNISEFAMHKDSLLLWAERELIPKAQLAYEGKGELKSGEHCRFCKARVHCKARASKITRQTSALLTDDDIAEILPSIDDTISWLNDIKDYALKKAINGKVWKGMTLTTGRATRKYAGPDEEIANAVINMGFNPYEKKLLPITRMERVIGKENIQSLVYKAEGKPKLIKSTED